MSITRDTYLTVDLDFWMNHSNETIQGMIDFLNAIKRCHREIHVVKYHNEVIPHIAQFPEVSRVVNVDYHSDIADICVECRDVCDFNEGTWANFVTGITKREFEWRYPSTNEIDLSHGYCHEMESPFSMSPSERKGLGWSKITMKHGLPRSFELLRCAAFSICVSPNWAPRNHSIVPAALLADLGFIKRKDVRKFSTDNTPSYIKRHNKQLYRSIYA